MFGKTFVVLPMKNISLIPVTYIYRFRICLEGRKKRVSEITNTYITFLSQVTYLLEPVTPREGA